MKIRWFQSAYTRINSINCKYVLGRCAMHISQSDKKQLKFITVVYKPVTNDWIMSVLCTRRSNLRSDSELARDANSTHLHDWCDHRFSPTQSLILRGRVVKCEVLKSTCSSFAMFLILRKLRCFKWSPTLSYKLPKWIHTIIKLNFGLRNDLSPLFSIYNHFTWIMFP